MMQFGLFIPQGWRHDLVDIDPSRHWEVMKSIAAHADGGPWTSIWVYDHFHTVPVPSDQATHEVWTLMAAFAASTSRIRLGQMCTCMAYRNPAHLAKVAATVDTISGGRTEMGIGAGWYEHEWRAYGYGFPRPGERLAMLREGVEIMKQAWETGSATLDGKHYQVDGAIVRPLPPQRPGLPIWIAGGGEKVTLRIAAEYAQYTNFADANAEAFSHKSALLQQHCADAGTSFDAITRSSSFNTIIASTASEVEERIRAVEARVLPYLGEERAASYVAPYRAGSGLAGTPEQVVERLSDMNDRGMGYGIFYFPEAAYDRSGIELFEREVMPALA